MGGVMNDQLRSLPFKKKEVKYDGQQTASTFMGGLLITSLSVSQSLRWKC